LGAAATINPDTAIIKAPAIALIARRVRKLLYETDAILGIGPAIVITTVVARAVKHSILRANRHAQNRQGCDEYYSDWTPRDFHLRFS
jgi:hypothetical protein